jgi:hypothetical protein
MGECLLRAWIRRGLLVNATRRPATETCRTSPQLSVREVATHETQGERNAHKGTEPGQQILGGSNGDAPLDQNVLMSAGSCS